MPTIKLAFGLAILKIDKCRAFPNRPTVPLVA